MYKKNQEVLNQLCQLKNSVVDPKQKFLIRFRIWLGESFGSGSESGFESGLESGFKSGIESVFKSRIQIPDSNPDPDQNLAKTFFFNYKF